MKGKSSKNNKGNLTKEQLRCKAVKLYEQNWKIGDICSALGCSRSWFYKWLNRYKTGGDKWFQSESRTPKTIHRSIDPQMKQLIIYPRKQLMTS